MSAAETKETTSSTTPPPPSGDSKETSSASKKSNTIKRTKKKKKHISKHVLKAKSDAKEKVTATTGGSDDTVSSSSSSKKKSSAAATDTVKDPTEASDYLKNWQAKEGWKFNKNTQSWLLRHMYETEKVSKSTFTILLEYLKGLQGKDAKKRVLIEATARAKRYREYEKAKQESLENKNPSEDSQAKPEKAAAETIAQKMTDDDSYGLEHWKTLDDHEKRKEYKRARLVLEVLTVES